MNKLLEKRNRNMSLEAHYFIAIKLSEEIKQALYHLQQQLMDDFSYKEWMYKADFHMTLKFLGSARKDTIHNLIQQLQRELNQNAFDVKITDLHTFGSSAQPRVLWLGTENTKSLNNLQQFVDNIAEQYGFPKEKRFYTPHITLAKKWKDKNKRVDLARLQHNPTFPLDYLYIKQIAVYQVFPQKQPKYVPIHMIDLKE